MKMTSAQMKTIRTLIANQQLYWEHGFTPEDLRSPCTLREMAEVAELGQAIREDMKSNHAPEEPKDRVMTGEELCYFVWETVTAWANEEYLANGPEVSFDERYQENAESWIKDLQEFLGVSS